MDSPFPYSQYVTGKNFVGRKSDVTLLGNLLAQGEHISLYEPPKTGKTSLVQQTLFTMRMAGKVFTVGQMSALNIRTPEDFLLRLGATLFKMVASTPEEMQALADKYLAGTHFVFDRSDFFQRGQAISLGWELDKADVMAMLRLPFSLARDREERIILIIDEFHCVGLLDDPDVILRPLDAMLKEQMGFRQFSFIFCGSAVNAMKAIFEGSLLFSRRVEHVYLSPVDELEMTEHVHRGFLTSGKVVGKDLLQGACRLFRGHVWYINHFASLCDSMSRGYIMEPVLMDALGCLLSAHEPRFREVMTGLTTHQVNLLKAIVDGYTRFSTAEVIRKYGLNSSANVKRVKDALMKKEVVVFDENDKPVLEDPLFEYWVKKYYFEVKE
ncbi:MAG: hypothetical protein J5669_05340 [Bacteroidales bacterium]|nr:hypothetical protein [Bacteroidales bacterium]